MSYAISNVRMVLGENRDIFVNWNGLNAVLNWSRSWVFVMLIEMVILVHRDFGSFSKLSFRKFDNRVVRL